MSNNAVWRRDGVRWHLEDGSGVAPETALDLKRGMKTCATCAWLRSYLSNDPSHGGECMQPAPVAAVVRGIVVTIRPSVSDNDRCGQWTSKEHA